MIGLFLAIHAQILTHPAGYFAALDADEIVQTVFPRERIRAGDLPVMTDPAFGLNGGGIVLAYFLAPFSLEGPEAATRAVRILTILVAAGILALWVRLWTRHLGQGAGLVAGLLLLFPNEGWITNVLPAFGNHNVGGLAAAMGATIGVPWIARSLPAGRGILFGAFAGYAGVALPASLPTIAAVWLAAVVSGVRATAAPDRGRLAQVAPRLLVPVAAGLVMAAGTCALDSIASGSRPLDVLFRFVWRPEGEGLGGTLASQLDAGLRNLLSPSRIWLMPAGLFYALLGLAAAGLVRVRRGRSPGAGRGPLPLVHALAAGLTLAVLLLTRFARGAYYEATEILPHVIALAAIGVEGIFQAGRLGKGVSAAFLAVWVASGAAAYQERFAADEPNLAYPKQVVPRAIVPLARKLGIERVAGSYQLAVPLAFHAPDLEVCCVPRTSCPTGCGEGFFAGERGSFLLPGPAGHLHGEVEAASLLGRVVSVARRRGLTGELRAVLTDGSVMRLSFGPHEADPIPPEASCALVVLPDARGLLSDLAATPAEGEGP